MVQRVIRAEKGNTAQSSATLNRVTLVPQECQQFKTTPQISCIAVSINLCPTTQILGTLKCVHIKNKCMFCVGSGLSG